MHILLKNKTIKKRILRLILHAGMENIFYAEDDKHSEKGVAKDNEQGMPEISESHGFEENSSDLVNGGKYESV